VILGTQNLCTNNPHPKLHAAQAAKQWSGYYWQRNVALKFTLWIITSGKLLEVYHRHSSNLKIITEPKEMLQVTACLLH